MAKKSKKPIRTEKPEKAAYTAVFREMAIKLALEGDKTVADVARELGLPESRLYSWVQSWKKKNGKVQELAGKSVEARIKQLEKRNKELEQENEILKKAAAYFAKLLL